jgi:hypothetical protein
MGGMIMKRNIELPCLIVNSPISYNPGEAPQLMIIPSSKDAASSYYFIFSVTNDRKNAKPSEILLHPSDVKAMADYLLMRLKDLDYKESDSK